MLAVCLLLRPVEPKPAQGRLLDFAPVFRNTKAMGFVLGYGAHCFELYGIRTWIVAFWTFVAMKNSDASILTPIVVSVVFSLLAMPASILGNEFALRFGRHRAITVVMFASAVVALLIGVFADQSPWFLLPLLLVYAITVPADSGALTSGMSMAAHPDYRGATMAAHSTVGFSLSALGAWASASRWTSPADRRAPMPGWPRSRSWRRVFCLVRWRSIGREARHAAIMSPGESPFPFPSRTVSSKTTAW